MKNAKNNNKQDYLGGAAIAAGGFGCVFLPALKCKGEERPTGKVVSKLLTQINADDEFNEAKEIQQILKTGLGESTYNKYFIFPEKQCTPDVLSKEDLINFDKKCGNLTKKGVTKKNINKNLSSIGIIELPNGGSDLDKTIKTMKSPNEFKEFNRSAINLLTNAVVPMNQNGVVHFDLKAPNILIDDDNQMRIIDWGLSLINKTTHRIPTGALRRPVQYNLPFGAVLFDSSIITEINKQLKKLTFGENYKADLKPQISGIMYNIAVKHFSDKASGHTEYVSRNLNRHFKLNTGGYLYFLCNLLTNYLTEAVINFIDLSTKKFDALKYFNDIIVFNSDVWGFITIYDDLLQNNRWLLTDKRGELEAIIYKYLYSHEYAAKLIDIDILVDELKSVFPFNDKIKTPPASINDTQPKKIKKNKNSTTTKQHNKPSLSANKTRKDALNRAAAILRGSETSVSGNVYKNGTKVIIKNNDDKKPRRKRCPNGTRKNTKTGKCESINKADKNEEVLTETKDDNKKLAAPPRSLSRRPVPPTYLDSDAHRPLDRDNNSLLARLGFSGTNDDNKPAEANDVNKPAKVLAEANDDNKKLADNNSLFARLGF